MNQCLSAALAVTELLQLFVQAVRKFQSGQRNPHLLAFIQRDAQVLDEVIYHEAGRVIATDDSRRQVVQRPAAGRAF